MKQERALEREDGRGSSKELNIGRVTITEGNPETDFWLSGYLRRASDFTFCAKVYDLASEFSIEGSRISKLDVKHRGERVMSYDRDWDQKPRSWKDNAVLKDIVASFPAHRHEDQKLFAKLRNSFRRGRGI